METIDATQILDNIWQGSKPPLGPRLCEAGFDVVVLCAKEYQPEIDDFSGVKVFRLPMYDNFYNPPTPDTIWLLWNMVETISPLVVQKKKILITCWAGLNRSGLLVATLLHHVYDIPGRLAARIVSETRQDALHNPQFVNYLNTL